MNGIFKKYLFLITLFFLFCNSANCLENPHQIPNNYSKNIIIPFEDFKKVFFNTQTFADYIRSNKILEEQFNLNINLKIDNQRHSNKLLDFIEDLFIEVIEKGKLKKNNFYLKLQNLAEKIKNNNDFYAAEIKLVKLKQEYFFEEIENKKEAFKNNQSSSNELYVNHIIDNIRYDIFLKFLNSNAVIKTT